MKLEGEGDYDFDIVGESRYQAELEAIAGPRETEGKQFLCEAEFRAEPSNPYDSNAIAVFIWQKKVGYFDKATAKAWTAQMKKQGIYGQTLTCDAMIVGGWRNNRGEEGHYGVKLDL